MKQDIRKEYLDKRNHIINRKDKSSIVCDKVKDNKYYQKSLVVGIYKSISSEVDTKRILLIRLGYVFKNNL